MVCVLEQGWNKTLQGCGPPGTEFDTPAVECVTEDTVKIMGTEMVRSTAGMLTICGSQAVDETDS